MKWGPEWEGRIIEQAKSRSKFIEFIALSTSRAGSDIDLNLSSRKNSGKSGQMRPEIETCDFDPIEVRLGKGGKQFSSPIGKHAGLHASKGSMAPS